MIAGLPAVLALELGITRRQFGIKEMLKGFIQIDTCLLECNRIKIFEPVILARFLRNSQQRLEVFFGLQFQTVTLVLAANDVQSLVIRKAHSTELAV